MGFTPSTTVREIVTDAAKEIGMLSNGESLTAQEAADLLTKFGRLLNNWNAEEIAVYTVNFSTFTLVPNLSPHTIGPAASSPTFTVVQRPVTVDGASLVLNTSSPAVDVPITIRDDTWWLGQQVKALTSTVPTDLYYSPDWPLGKLYFWPVPTVAYDVRLEIRILLDDTITLDTVVSLPPGYRDALTLTLAEQSCRLMGRRLPPDLSQFAREARARVFANNSTPVRIATRDSGMTIPRGNRNTFNYLIGSERTSWRSN